MKIQELEAILANYKKGTYRHITWSRVINLKNGKQIIKKAEAVERFGIRYGNLPSVKERNLLQLDMMPSQPLTPTEWIIKDFVKKSTNGKSLLMVYPTNKHKVRVSYTTLDGETINKSDIQDVMYAKDKRTTSSIGDMFCLNLDDVTSL